MDKLSFINILKERKKERQRYFSGYLYYAKLIQKKATEILGKCRVLVFGSALTGDYHPILSDIDVLIISPNAPSDCGNKSKIKMEILAQFGHGSPFEIHLVRPEEYEDWYSKFIQKSVEI